MIPDPPTRAERPARVAIPEALAADVATRPGAYRPDISHDHPVLVLACDDEGHAGAIEDASAVHADGGMLAWALVGSVSVPDDHPIKVGDRVLVLETRGIEEDEPFVATVVPGGDGGTLQVDTGDEWFSGVSSWALLPPAPAEPGPDAHSDVPAGPEPAETVSPGDLTAPTCPVDWRHVVRWRDAGAVNAAGWLCEVDGDLADEGLTPLPIPPGPWRTGSHAPRNLWIGPVGAGVDVGRMDSPELAAFVVDAVNRRDQAPTQDAYDAACRALEKHRADAERLRAGLTGLVNALDITMRAAKDAHRRVEGHIDGEYQRGVMHTLDDLHRDVRAAFEAAVRAAVGPQDVNIPLERDS